MLSIIVGLLVGTFARSWAQLLTVTAVAHAAMIIATNYAFNAYLGLTVIPADLAEMAVTFVERVPLALIAAAITFVVRRRLTRWRA